MNESRYAWPARRCEKCQKKLAAYIEYCGCDFVSFPELKTEASQEKNEYSRKELAQRIDSAMNLAIKNLQQTTAN